MIARFDVAVVGAGPAGAACAVVCARAGLSTLVLERAVFPREKVCGDCVNPACGPILERLGVRERVRALPHSRIAEVEFVGTNGRSVKNAISGELGVRRSDFDALILARARECGAEVREGTTVTALEAGWTVQTDAGTFSARTLVAADGRNSTVARLLGILPPAAKDRVGAQTHFEAPAGFGERVVMRLLPRGYCGLASVGGGLVNLCIVSRAAHLAEMQRWAAHEYALASGVEWRTITPLARAAVTPVCDRLLLVGDAARVVEPFTGEGIYYALASGELAARHVIADDLAGYARSHAALYRGRLWVNQLAKQAVLHPRIASLALRLPAVLRALTTKVIPPEAGA